MNKFIILLCFIVVISLHILVFLFYRKSEVISPPPHQTSTIQLQLTKVKELKKEPQKNINKEKNFVQKKEILKKEPSKKNISKKTVEKIEDIHKRTEELKTEEKKETTNIQTTKELENQINEENIKIQKLINDYAIKLREAINKNKNYPNISKKLKEEGKVIISFRVLKNGKFTDIKIQTSSNKERLDKAALNALYDTKEFESFHNINKEHLDFIVPLEFNLF